MTVRSLLRLFAGLALALFVASSWATPSVAHTGHAAPTSTGQQTHAAPAQTSKAAGSAVKVSERGIQTASQDCTGHMGQTGSAKTSCCSNACHAVMSSDLQLLQAVTMAVAILPTLPDPPAIVGPTTHIKRPPRPSAALVG